MENNTSCDELKIYPVFEDTDRPNYRETHENILAPPFRMCIVGASKTGKSVLLMNYVARSCYWGGDKDKGIDPLFEKIIVFSPNLGLDSSTRHLKKLAGDENIYTDYHDHMIDEIIQGLFSDVPHIYSYFLPQTFGLFHCISHSNISVT